MTVLCCLQFPPPPLRQIYTRRPCWGGERKRKSLLLVCHKISPPFGELFYTVLQHFIPNYSSPYTSIYFNYWVDPPCNTVHIHFPLDTRYFFVVHSTFVTFVYTHRSSVPTLKVHYCTPYILRHYCFCSLFTLLTAALPTVLYSSPRLFGCLSCP